MSGAGARPNSPRAAPRARTALYCAGLALLLAGRGAHGAEQIVPFTAHYDFSRNGVVLAEMTRTLAPAERGRYLFRSRSSFTGVLAWFAKDQLTEQSTWELRNGRPRPLRYFYRRKGGALQRHVELTFDWERGTVVNTVNDDPWRMDVPRGTLDKLLYQYVMMRDLQAGRESFDYPIADGGRLKRYRFVVAGEEKLATPLGTLTAVKLRRIEDKRKTEIWFAKDLHYLPIRIEQQEKDGSQLEMEIRAVEGIKAELRTED